MSVMGSLGCAGKANSGYPRGVNGPADMDWCVARQRELSVEALANRLVFGCLATIIIKGGLSRKESAALKGVTASLSSRIIELDQTVRWVLAATPEQLAEAQNYKATALIVAHLQEALKGSLIVRPRLSSKPVLSKHVGIALLASRLTRERVFSDCIPYVTACLNAIVRQNPSLSRVIRQIDKNAYFLRTHSEKKTVRSECSSPLVASSPLNGYGRVSREARSVCASPVQTSLPFGTYSPDSGLGLNGGTPRLSAQASPQVSGGSLGIRQEGADPRVLTETLRQKPPAIDIAAAKLAGAYGDESRAPRGSKSPGFHALKSPALRSASPLLSPPPRSC